MKKVLLAVAVVAFGFSFTSCKKCGSCTVSGVEGPEYCKNDSQVVYDAAKNSCALVGGTWNE